ncbi:hypothetical protein KUTeg_022657 [Tegillarca granosa]|uniref:PiggyBac transposable element-derived protein 4 C-terminal zinc-finger domain-containing protein n=1 Tax=Tegillarca granosa TaxID=220873 RepID=A0ABQ9DZZ9_TEGGR|nr:hypothetical protein KUTeg_022657 [Tegillarca granosa]
MSQFFLLSYFKKIRRKLRYYKREKRRVHLEQVLMNPQHQDFGNGLPPGLENHKSIGISKSKYCVVCLRNGTKTKSGWGVKTWSKCSECHVPLCSRRGERNCFYEYHLHAFGLEDRSTML